MRDRDNEFFIVPHVFNLNTIAIQNGVFIYISLTKLNRRQKTHSIPYPFSFSGIISRCHDPSVYVRCILSISSLNIFNPELQAFHIAINS